MRFVLLLFITSFIFSCRPSTTNKKLNNKPEIFRQLTTAEKDKYRADIQLYYDSILKRSRFNGQIIIAKNNDIIFEQYVGYNDLKLKDTLTPGTPFHVASISKTFTALTILHLAEQNKLKLDDDVKAYLPGFPYDNIKIKLLLNHRSGLPKYEYFLDKLKYDSILTNQDLLNYIIANKPALDGMPNKRYQYRNTNYALLALIAEKVTGIVFPQYMKDSVFTKLNMPETYVFSISDTANYKPSYWPDNYPARLENVDGIYGDKNVYTTARDLLMWDKALYENSFITKQSYAMATTPYSNERPSKHNYGYGFHLFVDSPYTTVYHNGWWHGNMASFIRLPQDTATIIVLSNRYNRAVYTSRKFAKAFGKTNNIEAQEESETKK